MKFDGISQKLQDAAAAMLAGKKAEVIAEEKKHPADCTCADCKKHGKDCDCAKCKAMKEEVEQIDELSRKTLGSYVKKAKSDLEDNAEERGYYGRGTLGKSDRDKFVQARKTARKRSKGIDRAVDKLTKEEFEELLEDLANLTEADIEQLYEISKKTLGSYVKKATLSSGQEWYDHGKNGIGNVRKLVNRGIGINRAADKLSKEEFEAQISEMLELVDLTEEELTELSKATLGSYINKASADGQKRARFSMRGNDPHDRDMDRMKAQKRLKGVAKAVGKLTKEELNIEELTIVSEEFGEGKILSINEGTATVVFIGNIVEIALDDIDIEETED